MERADEQAPLSAEEGLRLENFGALLRHLRETYGDRIGANRPGKPRVLLTAQALLNAMKEAGFSLTSGSYSEIEAGNSIPRDPHGFITVVSECLALNEHERQMLVHRLGYDIVKSKLGDLTDLVFKPIEPLPPRAKRTAAPKAEPTVAGR